MATQTRTDAASELFPGDGETAALMRALDWARTPLGPVEAWPQSLKTSVSICLQSRFALLIWWGPELVMLYNDSYVQLIGGKHPWALGSPGRKVWPEIWDVIGPMLAGVTDYGRANWADNQVLFLERHGYPEECYFTFSYSPIRDESGGVAGVFTPVYETTDRVIGERRLRTLRQLGVVSGIKAETVTEAWAAVVRVLDTNPSDLPFAAIYLFGPHPGEAPRMATLCASTTPGEEVLPFPEEIDFRSREWAACAQVAAGETCVLDLTAAGHNQLLPLLSSPSGATPVQAVVVPIALRRNAVPLGFLLAGVSARKRLDEAYTDFYVQIAAETAGTIREARTIERERALRSVAEAERAQIRRLFLNAPAAIAILHGPEHRFTLANESYLRLVDRDVDQLTGKPLVEALPELEGQSIVEILDEVYETGIPFFGQELRVRLSPVPCGEPQDRYFNFVYQPTQDTDGQIDGIFVLALDVTEQVAARREIESREEQFRVLANSIPQMAWMTNADGYITWYNQRWYDYTGTTLEQMAGWGWEQVQHPDFLPQVVARYKRSMESGAPFDMVYPLRGADGNYHSFLSRAIPLRDNAGKILRWFGTNTDIDASQKAEAALRQSEKLAVVGRLASSIAHEINNPLEAVTNLVYLARVATVNDTVKTYLASAEQELDRVSQITSQTLRFHRQQSAATMTDMAELADSVLALYRGKLSREGIELRLEVQQSAQLVCYAGEVRQVMANLIGNALDAMPHGGVLRLRLRPATDWRTGHDGVRLTVADTGLGMSAETRRRLYEPFYTTKGETGTGLGLWVSDGIIEKHGGSIHVRSRVAGPATVAGKSGTVFAVVLPHTSQTK